MSVTQHLPRHLPRPPFAILLHRGDDVLQVLRAQLAEQAIGNAWIVGRGTFDEVELRDGESTRTFATTCRVVSLDGRAAAGEGGGALTLAATVSRNAARGPEFLVGDVVRATAGTLELLVTPLDLGALPERDAGRDERDGPENVADRSPRGAERAIAPPAPWAALAEASAEAHERPVVVRSPSPVQRAVPVAARAPTYDPRKPGSGPSPLPPPTAPIPPRRKSIDEEIYPEPGDLLDHFTFGRCVVLRSDGDEMLVQNPSSGRTRTIRVSALHAEEPTEEDGKRLFRLTQRRST